MRRDAERRPDVVLVVELAQLELRVRDPVIGIEIRAVDRPPAVRHPVAALEIDGIEQRAATAPDAQRAAEEAQARLVEVVVGHADVRAAIQILRRLLEVEAAAFEHAYAVPELRSAGAPATRPATPAPTMHTSLSPSGGVAVLAQIDQHGGWAVRRHRAALRPSSDPATSN